MIITTSLIPNLWFFSFISKNMKLQIDCLQRVQYRMLIMGKNTDFPPLLHYINQERLILKSKSSLVFINIFRIYTACQVQGAMRWIKHGSYPQGAPTQQEFLLKDTNHLKRILAPTHFFVFCVLFFFLIWLHWVLAAAWELFFFFLIGG